MFFFFILPSFIKESLRPLRFSLEIFGNIFPRSYLVTVQVTKCSKSSCYHNHAFTYISAVTIITVVYYVETDLCLPFINRHKGRVHDVTHCFNLEKKCVPPY